LIKLLPKDDPEFAEIRDELTPACQQLFETAVAQEKAWADYLFKDGSMIGLNAALLKEYVEYIAGVRMESAGLKNTYGRKPNPLPWTQKWISGKEVQVSPQEVELSSYRIGDAKMDVTEKTFNGLSL
jgi:ribonucleoside-diphosphate reductase beta chain